MGTTKKYWKSSEERVQDAEFLSQQENEFPADLSIEEFLGEEQKLSTSNTSRRDFLKFCGFGLTAATLAACETPVIKSIPYVNKPEEVTPGVANWYASTYYDGYDFANVMVKTREGRPIHIKPSKVAGNIAPSVNARVNSSVLSLYNSTRLTGPRMNGEAKSWADVDQNVREQLVAITNKGGNVRLLTNTILSPSTKMVIKEFGSKFGSDAANPVVEAVTDVVEDAVAETATPAMSMLADMEVNNSNFKHITYDPVSYAGIRLANKESFGVNGIPSYHFDKADVIVSISADFLANWLMSTAYAPAYAKNRRVNDENGNAKMSRHFQFETNLSVTGSNADRRAAIKPSQEGTVAAALCNALGGSVSGGDASSLSEKAQQTIQAAADALKNSRGKSLVVAGSNDKGVQTIVNKINDLLGNYNSTIDLANATNLGQGEDAEVVGLMEEMKAGKVDALFILGVNPSYSLPMGAEFSEAVKNVGLSVSFSEYNDETAQNCQFICPDNNALESWNDFAPTNNAYYIGQPTISPLHDTRQAQESLLNWAGNPMDYLDYMKKGWEAHVFPRTTGYVLFADFWNQSVHDGGISFDATPMAVTFGGDLAAAGNAVSTLAGRTGDVEVYLYRKASGIGNHANNPFVQELPDPISKVTWDNYITMNPAEIVAGGYNEKIGEQRPASVATVVVDGKSLTLPVYPSPGQAKGTVGIALGYGRSAGADNIGGGAYQYGRYGAAELDANGNHIAVGKNAYPMVGVVNGTMIYSGAGTLTKNEGETFLLACTQTHHTVMSRSSIVKETTLKHFNENHATPEEFNEPHLLPIHENHKAVDKPVKEVDLWDAHPVEKIGHRWGLSIDLTTCIGCGSCVTACNSENNIPVVGKDEVRRSREMHWMRIDRYYSSDEDVNYRKTKKEHEEGASFSYAKMEDPSDFPDVTFVPMMCQHCNHAPCETVCPVAATTHSNEGLNQMTYNRCIGTRYCANNCPFKVRRFNWFNYTGYKKFAGFNPSQDELGRMILNPDVTVRARGVMEKCSLCVQSIQAGKLDAKKKGQPVQDGAIQTACSSSCPTDAITFGDYNDKDSRIAAEAESNRAYNMLEEVGVQPNITYHVQVRNKVEA